MKLRFLQFVFFSLSAIRERFGVSLGVLARARFWQWVYRENIGVLASGYTVQYSGRKSQREQAMWLLNLQAQAQSSNAEVIQLCEVALPSSICVPIVLSTIVTFDHAKSFDSQIAHINRARVRYFNKNHSAFRFMQVADDEILMMLMRACLCHMPPLDTVIEFHT